jgi:hypothetical protein
MLLGAAAGRFVTILAAASRVAFAPSNRPVVSGLVRAQARRKPVVTNLCHEAVLLNPQVRALAQAADGTRSRDELRIHLAQRGASGKPAVESELFEPTMQLAIKQALFTQ